MTIFSKRMSPAETNALASRAAGGDRDALGALYSAHQDTVLRLVRRHLHGADRADIEDAAQEVWTEVCAAIWAFDAAVRPFGLWLADLAPVAAERVRPSETAAQAKDRFATPLRLARMRLAVAA